ncbi:ATP-binding protein [Caldisphaera sp.]|uniref:ATP-binding protein n=1 Tax=Caldisphaera sp. TaxID=2060322 RepID=UPI0025B900DD|nr:ATP-binding protein [Caldisphaera sp.]
MPSNDTIDLRNFINQAKENASKNGEVVGIASRITPISYGKENNEIKAEIPFEVYLNKKFLIGSYIGISLPFSKSLILGRIINVERSDILAISKIPALTPTEDISSLTTPLSLTIELLSEEINGEVVPPSSPIDPQSPIFIPNKEFIIRMLGLPKEGVEIGNIMEGYKELDIRLKLTDEILRHHILIVGTTGAGKTNLLKVIMRNSNIPLIVFDIQGDYVKPAAELGYNIIVPITSDYSKSEINDIIANYLKRSNISNKVDKIVGPMVFLDGEKKFKINLIGFKLVKTYGLIAEVSPFFSSQGAAFFKMLTSNCEGTIDLWEKNCESSLKSLPLHQTTKDNIIRSVVLLRETGVIDTHIKEGKTDLYLDEPQYNDIISGKTVVDLRYVLEKGVSAATMSAFIIAERIFELVDSRYKNEGKETPFLMIFDEAHEYFPQSGRGDEGKEALEKLINRIMRLGRVRGIGTILATHRPTDLNDLILTLANTKIALRADEDALMKIGMDKYTNLLQSSPAGYGIIRTFSLKVHDLEFRSLKFAENSERKDST